MTEDNKRMTDDERRWFESVFQMYSGMWDQFNERRRTEFRVTLAIWAALAAAIGGSFTVSKPMAMSLWVSIPLAFLAVGVVPALHALWCWGVCRSQRIAQQIAWFYEGKLNSQAGTTFSKEIVDRLNEVKKMRGLELLETPSATTGSGPDPGEAQTPTTESSKKPGSRLAIRNWFLANWTWVTQGGITLLLGLTLVIVLFSGGPSKGETSGNRGTTSLRIRSDSVDAALDVAGGDVHFTPAKPSGGEPAK